MITEVKQFIEVNIDLIDANDFTRLYSRCIIRTCGKLTDVLYECGIDPLQYMTTVPTWFAYKSNITNITIPNNIKSIGDLAFYNCSSLTSVSIPDSVTSIGDSAFEGCSSLTSVSIPDSVTIINEFAFEDCGNLQITYSGTKQQWKHLVKGLKIFPRTTYVCNCSDGVVENNEDDI